MKKKLVIVALIFAAGFSYYLNGIAAENTKSMSDVEKAGKLWSKIQKEDYRNTWKMWPGKEAFYKGSHPHGALLTTYVNESAHDAIVNKKGSLPDGAIVIKENYMPDKKLGAITVIEKKDGYNPDAGDYFWVKFGVDGSVLTKKMDDGSEMPLAGKVPGCIGCHTVVKANDFLYTGPVK